MQCFGAMIRKLTESKEENSHMWTFFCDLFGLNLFTYKSNIDSITVNGACDKSVTRICNQMEMFVPFNIAISLYMSIKPHYGNILKVMFDNLKSDKPKDEIWLVLEKILLPPVLTSGSCIFNGTSHEKIKEDFALGMYFDQFSKLT